MTDQPSTLTVVGLGKLGSPMAACLAARGYEVIGVDVDNGKVTAINEGRAPVFETGLDEMLEQSEGRLSATTDLEDAVRRSHLTFVVVATPSDEAGGFSLKWVIPVCQAIGRALREQSDFHTIVLTSTVMPGSTGGEVREALEQASGKLCGEDFGLCYSPEFIALGSVIRDFLNPDFLLVGESDERAGDALEAVYRRALDLDAPVARMNFVNAELAKLAVNTFVTTKIAYANMLARICERLPDADVDVVTDAIGLDTRIGRKYLRGTISYGGPCFPRDNVALATLARSLDAPALVAEATDTANRDGIRRLAAFVKDRLSENGTVAVLGLAYKPNTDVIEEAPGLLLAGALAGDGVEVVVYDPSAMENARRVLGEAVSFASSATDAIDAADVIVVTTQWEEFRRLEPSDVERDGRPRVLIDCWRIFPAEAFSRVSSYVALGEGPSLERVSARPTASRGR